MTGRLMNWVLGELSISIRGAELERFINRCTAERIELRCTRRTDIDEMTARLSVRDFRRLSRVNRRTRCRVHITRRRGLLFAWSRHRGRAGLWLGLALMIFTCFELQTRLWVIKTDMTGGTDRAEIMSQLESMGVHAGMRASELDSEALKIAMRSANEELSFFAANVEGCVLTIVTGEAVETPEVSDRYTPRKVVAVKDGVIKKQIVRRGTEKHSVNDAVVKGEVLVDALVEPHEEWGKPRLVTADADIWAAVKHKTDCIMPAMVNKRGEILSSSRRFAVIVGKTRINLYRKQCPIGENCDRIYSISCVHLNEYLTLPIALYSETAVMYSCEERELDEGAVRSRMLSSARHRAMSRTGEGSIDSVEVSAERDGDAFRGRTVAWCYEQIGEAVEDGRTEQEIVPEAGDEEQTEESET